MRRYRLVVAFTLFGVSSFVGCVADSENPLVPEGDAALPTFDGAVPVFDAGRDATRPERDAAVEDASDATVVDSTFADTNQPDTNAADTNVADTNQPDTNAADTNVPDTNLPDTNVPDTNLPDTNLPDTNLPDTNLPDTNVPDTNVPDTNAPDVFDAGPPTCVAGLFGDYYLRLDGTVVHGPTSTVVVDDATSAPLTGLTQGFALPYSACALRGSDQTVWCWPSFTSGNNATGSLGNGTFTDVTDSAKLYRATEVQISHPDGGAVTVLDKVVALPSQSELAYTTGICAVRTDKSLWCWGASTQGSLWKGTTGTNADLAFATEIKSDADAGDFVGNVDQVSMGGRHACYVSAGQVYCWGDNTSGEQGTGDTTTQTYPFHVTTSLPPTVTSVAAGEDQTCALGSGQVWCWGADTYTSEGDPYVDASICNSNYCQPLPVAVLAAQADGGLTKTPLAGEQSLFMGYGFACAWDAAGSLRCWGDQTGTPTIVQEATPFTNPNASAPSGPIQYLSAMGSGGFTSQLRYFTTGHVYVRGTSIATQYCQ